VGTSAADSGFCLFSQISFPFKRSKLTSGGSDTGMACQVCFSTSPFLSCFGNGFTACFGVLAVFPDAVPISFFGAPVFCSDLWTISVFGTFFPGVLARSQSPPHARHETYEFFQALRLCINFASSTATWAAMATFDSIKALLAGILLPCVSSLILARINGVLACPCMPWSAASWTAWLIAFSIAALGIENSSGIGFANSVPD